MIIWRNDDGSLIIVGKIVFADLQFTLCRNSGPNNDSKNRPFRHLFHAILSLRCVAQWACSLWIRAEKKPNCDTATNC